MDQALQFNNSTFISKIQYFKIQKAKKILLENLLPEFTPRKFRPQIENENKPHDTMM